MEKGLIYSEKKPRCREKSRQVFEIVRDTLLNADGGDQHPLTSGKFVRNLIENYFVFNFWLMKINPCKNFFYLQKKLKKIFIENKAIGGTDDNLFPF